MFSIIISEKGGAERRETFDKNEINVGRVQGNELMLPKGNVSKHHARLLFRDGRFIVTDLKSTNGTYVNGRKIAQATIVREGDKIYVGDFILRVDMGGSGAVDEASEASPAPMMAPPQMPAPAAPPPAPMMAPQMPAPMAAPPAPPPMPPVPVAKPAPPAMPVPSQAAVSPRAPAPPREQPVSHYPLERDPDEGAGPSVAPPVPQAAPPAPPRMPAPPRVPSMANIAPPQPVRPAAAAPAQPAAPAPAPRAPSVAPPAPKAQAAAAAPRTATAAVASTRAPLRETGAQAGQRLALVTLIDRIAEATDLGALDARPEVDSAMRATLERVVAEQARAMVEEEGAPEGTDIDRLTKLALQELVGLGPFAALLEDDDVTEVHALRHDQIVVGRSAGPVLADTPVTSDAALARIVRRLAAQSGQRIPSGETSFSCKLPRGARLVAFLPPASATHGLIVHKRTRGEVALEDLVRLGSISRGMATFLDACIAAKANVLVCGSAHAAVQAVLGALAAATSGGERVVVTHDPEELATGAGQALRLNVGAADAELLHAAVTTHPDRWVIGALAGPALAPSVSAIAAGATGVLAGCIAPSLRHALGRLSSQLVLAHPGLGADAARACVTESFDVAVEAHALPDGRVRVARIAEFGGDPSGTRDLFVVNEAGEAHAPTGVVPHAVAEFGSRGVRLDPNLFKKLGR